PFHHGKDMKQGEISSQPGFILIASSRNSDAKTEFAKHNNRQSKIARFLDHLQQSRVFVQQGGKRVRIENHKRSSGSIFSNSDSIARSIALRSFRKCRNAP